MNTDSSNFVALLDRLRWIKRWGLKRNVTEENVMEHSWQVASICHLLCLLHNREVEPEQRVEVGQVVLASLYHDCSEVLTSDLPTPIKYHNPEIRQAFALIEQQAELSLLNLVPSELQSELRPLLLSTELPASHKALIKAADLISALIKCHHELQAGNLEFRDAQDNLQHRLSKLELPGLKRYLQLFATDNNNTLDRQLVGPDALQELLAEHDKTEGVSLPAKQQPKAKQRTTNSNKSRK